MRDPDYYAALGLGVEAEPAAIRQAYWREIAKLRQDPAGTDESVARARLLEEARAVLLNPVARAAYDAHCVGDEVIDETVAAILRHFEWRN